MKQKGRDERGKFKLNHKAGEEGINDDDSFEKLQKIDDKRWKTKTVDEQAL